MEVPTGGGQRIRPLGNRTLPTQHSTQQTELASLVRLMEIELEEFASEVGRL